MRKILSKLYLLNLVLFAIITISSPKKTFAFSESFPSYTDTFTNNKVYQITEGGGKNYTLYYHQYHFLDPRSVVIAHIEPGDWLPTFFLIDLFSGEKKIISHRDINGEHVNNRFFYGFKIDENPPSIVQIPLYSANFQKTKIYTLPLGWTGTGAIQASSDDKYLIFIIKNSTNPSNTRHYLLNISSKELKLLYETTNPSESSYEHYQFSPLDSNLFTLIDQNAKGLSRIKIGNSITGQLTPLKLEYSSNISYFEPSHLDGTGLAHPVWNSDGKLCTDILWHSLSPASTYGFGCFTISRDLSTVPISSQQLRFININSWNNHYARSIIPGLFIGDGDLAKQADGNNPNNFVNLMQLTNQIDSTLKFRTNIVNIASIKGTANDHANAHLVANGTGVITTFNYDINGNATSNVFLIEINNTYQTNMTSYKKGDLNNDNQTNLEDYDYIKQNFHKPYGLYDFNSFFTYMLTPEK